MNAQTLLLRLLEMGVELRADGDRLLIRPASLPPVLLVDVREHKRDLLRLLIVAQQSTATPADLPADWREVYEERAAIREFDGGQAREHAEAEALVETVLTMIACNATSPSVVPADGLERECRRRAGGGAA